LDLHSSRLHGTTAPVLAAPALVHERRSGLLGEARTTVHPFFSHYLPLLLSRQWNRGKGKNPKWLVGRQQGLGLGV
jgi:hypothetical protein